MNLPELRQKAESDFKTKGFPSKKEELWRFTDVSPVAEHEFNGEWKPAEVDYTPVSGIYAVFENGRLIREKSSFENLPDGVRIASIMDVADDRIGTLADAQSAFVAANTAWFSDGLFIEVQAGIELDEPIHLIFLGDAPNGAFHLRNFVSAGTKAKVTLFEEYIGAAGTVYWTNAVTEVFVDDGGSVDHYKVQRESDAAYHFQTLESSIGAEALFSNHAVTLGSRLGRNDIRGKITGEESEAICNGLYLLKDKQHFDTHLFMDHAVPKCNSHELYKGILDDKAHAVFCGRILVQQDAQQTDAIQHNGNLLLSRDARINTLPQLEIYADDVKCTHGATVGELDELAMYYMQTRGIEPKVAHAMLTFAFANEVLDEVQCRSVKDYVETLVHDWLDQVDT